MNKVMNLRTRELLLSGIVGAMWIIYGLMRVLNVNKTIDLITSIVFLITLVISIVPYFIKTEKQDEMAKLNMNKARSMVCELLLLGIMVCLLISTIKDSWVVDMKIVMSFLIGIGFLFKYIFFIIYEKAGE